MKNGPLYKRVSTWKDSGSENLHGLLKHEPILPEPALEEYLEIVDEGNNAGKSALWFMAFNSEQPCSLEVFLKKFEFVNFSYTDPYTWWSKGRPTGTQMTQFKAAMLSHAENGRFKGNSAFSILSHNCPAFALNMHELLKSELTIDHLLACPIPNAGGQDKYSCFLRVLLTNDPQQGESLFMELLVNNFRDKDITTSYRLVELLHSLPDRADLINKMRDLYSSDVKFLSRIFKYSNSPLDIWLTDIFVKQPHLLSGLVRTGDDTSIHVLNRIVDHHNGEGLSFEDLLPCVLANFESLSIVKIWEIYLKDKRFDWYFDNNLLSLFAKLFKHTLYINEDEKTDLMVLFQDINHTHWLRRIAEGAEKNKSLLWYLVENDFDHDQFVAVWDGLKENITWEDLVVEPVTGNSILIMLAQYCSRGRYYSQAFMMLYNCFADRIQLQHLTDIFQLLVRAVPVDRNEINVELLRIIKRMVKHHAGFIHFNANEEMLLIKIFPSISVLNLIKSRNELFNAIKEIESVGAEEDYDWLMQIANMAEKAGYISTFYDVGQLYILRGDLVRGYESFEKVSAKSIHYQSIVQSLADYYFNSEMFNKALHYTLQIENDDLRKELVQKIACHFGCEKIPEIFLKAINAQTTVDGCIQLFGEIVRHQLLDKDYKYLTVAFEIMNLDDDKKENQERVRNHRNDI